MKELMIFHLLIFFFYVTQGEKFQIKKPCLPKSPEHALIETNRPDRRAIYLLRKAVRLGMRISGDKITGLMGFSILFVTLFLFAGPSHAVTLVWNESPDDDVVGYRIYWGGASRQYSWMVELESAVYCDPASNECQYDLSLIHI